MAKNNTQPTYKRQRFLLAFIRQLRTNVTSTDLQKLVFLYTMKENSGYYEFIPYKYGSFSFQLAEDVETLRRDGYLMAEASRIQAIGDYTSEELFPIESQRGDNLIRKVYHEYPYYAINSQITNRLFQKSETECFKRERQNYTQTEQVLFTIGYEGQGIESFINVLIRNDIHLLCDVRKNPISRKFGFSKNKLEHITDTIGIKYIHTPDLGIESNKRGSLDSINDYKNLFESYAKTLPNYRRLLEEIYYLLCSNSRVALMCYEKEPEMCHRHVIRDYLSDMYKIKSEDL